MPLEALMTTVQNEAGRLAALIQGAALDAGAYDRAYWIHWRKLPADWGITHAQRECELACRELGEQRLVSQTLVDQQRVRFDALVAVLRARSA
jgi:hypothetical protein